MQPVRTDKLAVMPELVALTEIRAAARRLAGITVRTPLVRYAAADDNAPLLVKPESLQPIGAFKLRGAYAAVSVLAEEDRARGVVTHSSGNHAQAVAYAARSLGIRAVIVAPDYAPAAKLDGARELGAELVLVDGARGEVATRCAELAAEEGYVVVPPYDDRHVITGQGTVGLEILEDAPSVDVVLVPVSGGGLISGVSAAVNELRPEARVIGVEPELAADAQESLRGGTRVEWPAESTRRTSADGLRVAQVGALTFPHLQRYVDDIVTVTEAEIAEAMRRLVRHTRLVAEPSGAVATAAYLFHRRELPPGRTHVAVLSGGNLDPATLAGVLAEPGTESS